MPSCILYFKDKIQIKTTSTTSHTSLVASKRSGVGEGMPRNTYLCHATATFASYIRYVCTEPNECTLREEIIFSSYRLLFSTTQDKCLMCMFVQLHDDYTMYGLRSPTESKISVTRASYMLVIQTDTIHTDS